MRGAGLVAIAASIGNLLQGWDDATIAGAMIYIKKEFSLESDPTMEGLIVAMSLIGATIIITFTGTVSDWLGRRRMLIISSLLFNVSAVVMFWSPNVYILLLARLLDGFGIGLALTLAPIYISEIAPSDIRGKLNTLPQLAGSVGMFFSYCMDFGMSLMDNPSWRLMLAVMFIPSIFFVLLTIFYLPESPRWLVSKGRMAEAKQVLQELRRREDVSGEMALLVEGLGVGVNISLEEYLIQPVDALDDEHESVSGNGNIKLYQPEEGLSWIAKPITSESGTPGILSRHGSVETQGVPLMDTIVTLFGSLRSFTNQNLPEAGCMRNMFSTTFPELGGQGNVPEERGLDDGQNDQWDEESVQRDNAGEGYGSDDVAGDVDENLHSPLLSGHTTAKWDHAALSRAHSNALSRANSKKTNEDLPPIPHDGTLSIHRRSNIMNGHHGSISESFDNTGVGDGWQLAWRWTGPQGRDSGSEEGKFQRVYIFQERRTQSMLSLPTGSFPGEIEPIQAAALVSQPALFSNAMMAQHPVGPAMVHPSETTDKGPKWTDLFEPGVKRALILGITLQILEQFSGISGVLYYTPQILKKTGAFVLLVNIGINDDSSSLLISGITALLMLPCILVAMRLMDTAGRRKLLLKTVPVLIISLVILVVVNSISMSDVPLAAISCFSVIVYLCCFVTGFGPIPNIVCAEIFPTRVRGICIALCSLSFYIGNIIVTYTLPVLLSSVGLKGVFGIYAAVCCISWVFIFLKVPETMGMPLEVITEFFAMSPSQKQHVKFQD